MASRAARSIFSAAARASARPARGAQHIGRRYNSASSHGSSATSSDKPWIVGRLAVLLNEQESEISLLDWFRSHFRPRREFLTQFYEACVKLCVIHVASIPSFALC